MTHRSRQHIILICIVSDITDVDVAHAQWSCCGVRGPRDFTYSAWYNMTRDNAGEFRDVNAVPASCCPPDDVTARLRHRCQQAAARLQLDSAPQTVQNHNFYTTYGQSNRNYTFHLQVTP